MTSPAREVLDFACGVRVYPPAVTEPYWRIRWTEGGRRREMSAVSQEAAVEKAAAAVERLGRGIPTDRSKASVEDLVAHYLDPGRRPTRVPAWSIRHRGEQERYCERHILPALRGIRCSKLTTLDLARVLARASTPSVAEHLRRCLSALVAAGIDGGYLLPGQCRVDGLPANRPEAVEPLNADRSVMPDEIPSDGLVHDLAAAAAAHQGVWWRELELLLTAYSGLRFGEHAALVGRRLDVGGCRIAVAQQVVEASNGQQTLSMPKGRKRRITAYPETTPCGLSLAAMVERRVAEVGPEGPLFPAPLGGWVRRSNFSRNVWTPAAIAAGWPRRGGGRWMWTFHSLRHVFASWALGLEGVTIEDVSRFMGHSSTRVTAEIYVHLTASAFDRFRFGSVLAVGDQSACRATRQLALPLAG